MLQADRSGPFLSRASIRADCDLTAEKIIYNLRRQSGGVGGVMEGRVLADRSEAWNAGEVRIRNGFGGGVRETSGLARE
ncbi:hypothetical protein ACIQUG_25135 [Ensifer sp. NPDC090286]|uniref:hypothetical protein n=1 Tax=Ensifer sp. NPDC090286 TaxID=3363991 RepID=UPI00383B75A4